MTAYFIANVQVADRKRFEAYQKGIVSTIKPFKGWILAADPGTRLEGDLNTNHNVIIRFPTLDAVRYLSQARRRGKERLPTTVLGSR